jgi:7,8-dihydropterin-6-yl-methyl-4-(beta-D-ribofuranosyl)aminobenzene 5'-phosphate synthase
MSDIIKPKVVKIIKPTKTSIEKLKITVLVEDSVNLKNSNLIAKHGLSLLVETKLAGVDSKFLMDAGPGPDIAIRNADLINKDLKNIDSIMLSHGHYDHTGALLQFLRHIGHPTPILAHPKVFNPKFAYKPALRPIGIEFDQSAIKAAGGELLLTRDSITLLNGVISSGEILRKTYFENTPGFWTVECNHFIEDIINDDQALSINVKDKGLVILTGCAHAGIVNTVRHVKRITGIKKVYAIVGGFHLEQANDERIQKTIKEFTEIGLNRIYPCHCTGKKAISQFAKSFGDFCIPLNTGNSIEF